MATVTLEDGSQLELTEEEFMLYLRATDKVVAPKSQAEIIAEKMIELRAAESANAAQCAETHEEAVQNSLRESAEHELAQAEADATNEPVEIGNYLVMPGGRVLPKHVVRSGVIPPPRPRRQIPFTKRELEAMQVLRDNYPNYMTTKQIAEVMGHPKWELVSGHLSSIFTTGCGLKKGARHTWALEVWAQNSQWVLDGTPSRRWPPE